MLYHPSGLVNIDLPLREREKPSEVQALQLARTIKPPVRALGFEPRTSRVSVGRSTS